MRRVRGWCWALLAAAVAASALCGGHGAAGSAPAPLRCPPELSDHSRCQCTHYEYGFLKCIVDGDELQLYVNGDCFTLKSPRSVLDEAALPSFEVKKYYKCALFSSANVKYAVPSTAANNTSYAAILRAFNVSVSEKLTQINGTLRSEQLAGLNELQKLELSQVDFEPSARDLRHLTGLHVLRIVDTEFTTTNLEHLPAGLEVLQLINTKTGFVPAAPLNNLTKLTTLLVSDEMSVHVEVAKRLQMLDIGSTKATNVSFVLSSGLLDLYIKLWAPDSGRPQPWEACTKLRTLELNNARVKVLPTGWVKNCSALRNLIVTGAKNLTTLEQGVLHGALKLKRIILTNCALKSLPDSLLKDAENLTILDLSYNNLIALPSNLFLPARSLTKLRLTHNQLDSSALDAVKHIGSLKVLNLYKNTALNACPTENIYSTGTSYQLESMLHNLKNLAELNLSYTNTSLVCPDWRHLPHLAKLLLDNTALVRLKSDDLQFNTATRSVTVSLIDTNVTSLEFFRRDLDSRAHGVQVRVQLNRRLNCDCELYWAAVVLCRPETAEWLSVTDARCADHSALCEVPHDKLVCAAPPTAPCPEGCKCGVREDRAGRVLQLDCESSGLRAVPRLHDILAKLATQGGGDYAVHLGLANNSIHALSPEDLPPELTALDLRNNSLSLIDNTTANTLIMRENMRVWLAGNPLQCDCHFAQAFDTMVFNPNIFEDLKVATCVDGRTLKVAAINHTPPCKDRDPPNADSEDGSRTGDTDPTQIVVVALGVVAVVGAALALALLRPELRLRAKRALRAWGLLPRAREADDGRVYDAFVSFAHADEAVVHELVSRLESGTSPLRLCVHYRDWVPGGWIPTQIAASVRVSRRTVAVVSAAFLRSAWARAEFREAYAAALRDVEPRLVVVLLEDPARLPLDAELRAYLSANTYVRWGDPWFWPKLRRALPVPRPIDCNLPSIDVSVGEPSAATLSTDASDRSEITLSTTATECTEVTSSTNVSERSAATSSINASEPSEVTSTNTSERSESTLTTNASERSAATSSTNAPERTEAVSCTDATERSAMPTASTEALLQLSYSHYFPVQTPTLASPIIRPPTQLVR